MPALLKMKWMPERWAKSTMRAAGRCVGRAFPCVRLYEKSTAAEGRIDIGVHVGFSALADGQPEAGIGQRRGVAYRIRRALF